MKNSGFSKAAGKLEGIKGKTVAIAGVGSVGSTIATILAREDVDLRLIDMGRVEEEDMHRLDLFHEEDITKFKVKQAKQRLSAINPKVQVKSFHEEIVDSNVFLMQGDVLLDATNSDEINALTIPYAAKKRYPLVIVRIAGSSAKILVLSKAPPAKIIDKLSLDVENRIFGPTTTMAASIAVAEILKLLLGEKNSCIIECDAWEGKLKITKI